MRLNLRKGKGLTYNLIQLDERVGQLISKLEKLSYFAYKLDENMEYCGLTL